MLSQTWLLQDAVADRDAGPIRLLLFNELQMSFSDLIDIVRGAIFKNAMKRNVVFRVHFSNQLGVTATDGKVDQAVVIVEVFVACGDQGGDSFVTVVMQSKENMVGESGHHFTSAKREVRVTGISVATASTRMDVGSSG